MQSLVFKFSLKNCILIQSFLEGYNSFVPAQMNWKSHHLFFFFMKMSGIFAPFSPVNNTDSS